MPDALEDHLDLFQLDPVSPDLHLLIATTIEAEALGLLPDQVTGPVRRRPEFVDTEPFRGPLRIPVVPRS